MNALVANMSALEADELETAIVAAGAPHMSRHARARLMGRLRRVAEIPRGAATGIEYKPVAPEDMAAAQAWFEQQGVVIETKRAGAERGNDG